MDEINNNFAFDFKAIRQVMKKADELWVISQVHRALRLCVWLFDDGYMQFFCVN